MLWLCLVDYYYYGVVVSIAVVKSVSHHRRCCCTAHHTTQRTSGIYIVCTAGSISLSGYGSSRKRSAYRWCDVHVQA